jgi:hypothetical protein
MMIARSSDVHSYSRTFMVNPARSETCSPRHVLVSTAHSAHKVIMVSVHSLDGSVSFADNPKLYALSVIQACDGKSKALACGLPVATDHVLVPSGEDGEANQGKLRKFPRALLDVTRFAKGVRPVSESLRIRGGLLFRRIISRDSLRNRRASARNSAGPKRSWSKTCIIRLVMKHYSSEPTELPLW